MTCDHEHRTINMGTQYEQELLLHTFQIRSGRPIGLVDNGPRRPETGLPPVSHPLHHPPWHEDPLPPPPHPHRPSATHIIRDECPEAAAETGAAHRRSLGPCLSRCPSTPSSPRCCCC